MITIEVCYIDGLEEQNFNLAKCLSKLRRCQPFHNESAWIRINPNYVKILDRLQLIEKNEANKSFVRLTKKANEIVIINDTIHLSLEEYFVHESDIQGVVKDSLGLTVNPESYKVLHNTCHCCGKSKTNLNHVVDEASNNGMYCNYCLTFGYDHCITVANHRRKEAQDAYRIR